MIWREPSMNNQKFILLLLFVFGITSLVVAQEESQNEVISLSDPVETTEDYEVYGSEFENPEKVVPLKTMIAKKASYQDQKVATEGQIKQVCQKKGCFFILSGGKNEARITFKDYSFFIPTNSAGKQVVLKGTFNVEKLPEEKAKHYAKDAGEDPDKVKGPQEEFSLVATSVKIIK